VRENVCRLMVLARDTFFAVGFALGDASEEGIVEEAA
jgi:hypothetical protein